MLFTKTCTVQCTPIIVIIYIVLHYQSPVYGLRHDFNTCLITKCHHYHYHHPIIITCMSSSLSDVDHIVRMSPSRHPSSAFCRCAPPLFPPPDIFMLSDHISPPPTSRISYIISHKKPFPRDHCVIVFLNPSKGRFPQISTEQKK